MNIHIDMYQTLALAVLVLMLGQFLKRKFMYWRNSVFPLRLSADCYLPFLRASVMPPVLQNLILMIHYGKYVWYFSSPRLVSRQT